MSQNGQTLVEFKTFIIETLNLEDMTADMIADDDPLFGDGLGLDSVDALELVVGLEKRYEVKIRSQEIDPAVFASARSFFEYVQARMGDRRSVPE